MKGRNAYAALRVASFVQFQGIFAHPLTSTGSIGILNKCDTTVYLKITRESDYPIKTLVSGASYRENYQFPAQGGTSMKLANNTDSLQRGENEVQLEYTCTDQCYVDFSLIDNAAKFPRHDAILSLKPSDPICDTLTCVAGNTTCRDAYYTPTDNQAVRACSLKASWTFTLCEKPQHDERNAKPTSKGEALCK